MHHEHLVQQVRTPATWVPFPAFLAFQVGTKMKKAKLLVNHVCKTPTAAPHLLLRVSTVQQERRPKPEALNAPHVRPEKQVPVSMVRANNAKQASSDQLRMQMLQPVRLAQRATIKTALGKRIASLPQSLAVPELHLKVRCAKLVPPLPPPPPDPKRQPAVVPPQELDPLHW